MDKLSVLNNVFHYDSFKKPQESIIDSILSHKDTLAIMQTGGGKSICFQIPALIFKGITIVITPLISLMIDQVRELSLRNISARYINSSLSNYEIKEVLSDISSGKVKILYIGPEKLLSLNIFKVLSKVEISLFVVDEAHTIMWHMDFRTAFLNIKVFLSKLGYKPVVALFTATINDYAVNHIKDVIGIYDFNIIKGNFDRSELFYSIEKVSDKLSFLTNYINSNNECGIIYTSSRKDCEYLYSVLSAESVTYYHGGLEKEIKLKNQNDFLSGRVRIMVATISFGLGINKPDIRFIINYNIPSSLESLAQMMGRCSRDKKYGECILLYDSKDIEILKYFISNISFDDKSFKDFIKVKRLKTRELTSVLKLCSYKGCIHKYIANYFGENIKSCGNMCSSCRGFLRKFY